MAERQLEIELLLQDKQALSRLKSAFADIKIQGDRAESSMSSSFLKTAAAIGAVVVAARGISQFFSSAIKEASQQEDAINRLNVALQNQGTFSQEVSNQYQQMATELQSSTRFADDAILTVQQRLAAVGNVGPQDMGRVTAAVLDFATITNKDLVTASELFAKAAQGNTTALSRYGLVLDESIPKSLRFEAVLQKIKEQMSGAARADVNTYSGAVDQLGNVWRDFQKEVGSMVTQSPEVKAIIRTTSELIAQMTQYLKENKDQFDFMGQVGEAVFKFLALSAGFTVDAFQDVGTSLIGIVLAFQKLQVLVGQGDAAFAAELENQFSESLMGERAVDQVRTALADIAALKEQFQNDQLAGGSILEKTLGTSPDQVASMQARTTELFGQFMAGFGIVDTSSKVFFDNFAKNMGSATKQASTLFASSLTQIILHGEKASEAFKKLGLQIAEVFLKMALEMAIQQALALTFQKVIGAATGIMAAGLAKAWAPAAALASLATLGGNAGPASAGIVATAGVAQGVAALASIPGAMEGGIVNLPGSVLVGERGPEFLNLPRGASITPLGGDQAGTTIYNNVVIHINNPTGKIDDDLMSYIKQEVSDHIFWGKERL